MHLNLKRVIAFISILLLIFIFFYFDLSNVLSLQNLKSHLNTWENLYKSHSFLFILFFSLIYIIACFGIPITIPLMLISGAIFGKILGTIIALLCATLGGGLAFLFIRHLFQSFVYKKYGHYLNKIENQLMASPFLYIFGIRVSGMVPHLISNILFGISHVPFRTFIFASFFGMAPAIFIYVQAGSMLMKLENTSDILSGKNLLSLSLLAVILLFSALFKRFKR